MGLRPRKTETEPPETRDELVGRLYEEDAQKAHYWGTYHTGPILRGVTNSQGKLEKSGLVGNTLYVLVRTTDWAGKPTPQAMEE